MSLILVIQCSRAWCKKIDTNAHTALDSKQKVPVCEEMLSLCFKETESEPEDNLDDLEKHLREKALRSMRKAQVSPPSQAESFDIMYILFGLYSEFNFKLLNVFELQNITFVVIIARLRFTMYKGHGFTLQKVSTVYQ